MNLYISSFNKFLVVIAILLVILSEAYVSYYYSPFRGMNHDIRDLINAMKPDLIGIGDRRIISRAVDTQLLNEELSSYLGRGFRMHIGDAVGFPEAESGLWYLLIRNEIATSNVKKIPLIVFFLEDALTSKEGGLMTRYSTYSERENLARDMINQWLACFFLNRKSSFNPKKDLEGMLGGHGSMKNEVKDRPLLELRRRPFHLGNTIPDRKAFMRLVESSLLPDIIRESKEFKLVMVEFPGRPGRDPDMRAWSKSKYRQYLSEYLKGNNVIFVSLVGETAFQTETIFSESFRVAPKSKAEVTKLIAKKLYEAGVFDAIKEK